MGGATPPSILDLLAEQDPERLLQLAAPLRTQWFHHGLPSETFDRLDAALRLHAQRDAIRANALVTLAAIARARGDYGAAQSRLDEAIEIADEIGDRGIRAVALNEVGAVRTVRGDFAGATERHVEALALFTELGEASGVAYSHFRLGITASLSGDLGRARAELDRALPGLRGSQQSIWLGAGLIVLGVTALQQGDIRTAEPCLVEGLVLASELDNVFSIAQGLEGLAGIAARRGEHARALRCAAAGSALRASAGIARIPHYSDLVGAWLLPARQALGPARTSAAWREGEALGMREAVGYALGPFGAEAADARPPITARERQVARLVALGRTDRQIAEELGISERTAEAHVEHIRRKLGFVSRVQIAAWIGAGAAH